MQEIIISLDSNSPVDIFGINHEHVNIIKDHFPKLKIVARGNEFRAKGNEKELLQFTRKVNALIEHYNTYNVLDKEGIKGILNEPSETHIRARIGQEEVLVYGTGGTLIRARTQNQLKIVEACEDHDMVFAIGPAGTGKTYTAVALAVRALKNHKVERIILTRPAVEAGENLGFLPGDLKDKLDPYILPLYDALYDMIPSNKLHQYLEDGTIQIAPLAFMRGRTLDNAFVILDEAQNASANQMKMFLTRMGANAQFIVTGDISQVDLPRNQQSGLVHALRNLENIEGIAFVRLGDRDVIRHPIVKDIIKAYDKEGKK
ncbi:MAG TPA: phosphate starvation-inducible protein PhoH [Flavobacteriales bacterium]|mgnify:CR=1 FL=1|nr:phosphate starvation-inducible protein PhoH [Flavobacteriales bacterium]